MQETVLIGGYTRQSGKGIYRASFDSDSKQLTTPTPFITSIGSPTYLAVSKANGLYTVDADGDQGGVAAVDLSTTPPTVLNTVLATGSSPAHISIDETRQLVFASNYHEGRVNVYRINTDKSLTQTDVATNHGFGPRPEQEASHIHFAALTPDQQLAVIDLGTDEIFTYPVSDAGKLGEPKILKLPAGFGPRHLVFNHQQNIAYLLGELSSQVQVLTYDHGTFALVGQPVATIPDDWTAHNGAAAIRLSHDDRFLYVSNRGHNSLAVFALDNSGLKLNHIQQISTEGDFPRDFNLDLTETALLAVNQNSNNGTLYARDVDSGLLTELVKDIPTPEAVNVLFLPALN
ncbi:lactonase family protein [Lacticaseibacillus brantae]|uniref:3-carboxymuconate cyclase n=1 Tax=Lacticaseibacillus brantae DSM 23927 TaxID=1423727 RepID=A0A0R2AZ29_9LACO|nr:lactonase family protein [Lacticaseibacillus brantae]KRM72320.1 3-carboxymuconate cyclase [Lacticaseibacillus brantae DSM 23927]